MEKLNTYTPVELYGDPEMDQACYLSKLMGRLNKSYDDKDNELPEYVRDRWGLISTYIYAVGDSLLRKHKKLYLKQFAVQTLDVLLSIPDDQIVASSIKDMNKLPPTFRESIDILVGRAFDADPRWERHFEAHIRHFNKGKKGTGVSPEEFGFGLPE